MTTKKKLYPIDTQTREPLGIGPLVEAPPDWGTPVEITDGVLWIRLPLPFALNHVNVYLMRDEGGWALLDTGIDDARTRDIWQGLFSGPLSGERVTRVIVSHYHPDHVGLAGWLARFFDVPIHMSQTDYLLARNLTTAAENSVMRFASGFLQAHGLDPETAAVVTSRGQDFLSMCSPLPDTFRRLAAGMTLRLDGELFDVMSGGGHAPEQIMLYNRDGGTFLSTDQVLQRISPNVSVSPASPDDDPLSDYLDSLAAIREHVQPDVVVLPGHGLPFKGLHARVDELTAHHHLRCDQILASCRNNALTVAELLPVLFPRALDPQQRSFAFGEALAHVNYLLSRERLYRVEIEGTYRYRTSR